MIETARRKFVGDLNSRYIYGRVVSFPSKPRFDVQTCARLDRDIVSTFLSLTRIPLTATTSYHYILNRDGDHNEIDRKVQFLLC
jgi:hypothetical protein